MPQTTVSTAAPPPLWNRGFVVMSAAAFFTFCNMAVFFAFAGYLRTLPIDPRWHGTLIGAFALVPIILRPFVSPFFTPANAARSMAWLAPLVAACLLAYNLALDAVSMLVVRVVHGAVYVLLMSANMAGFVGCVHPQRSGQAFGYVAVIVLLPYAVIPPLMDWVGQGTGGYLHQLNLAALAMLCIPPLMLLVRRGSGVSGDIPIQRPNWAEVKADLGDRRIICLMSLALLLYTSMSVLFFYTQGFGHSLGLANPGWFFTCATIAEILVRMLAGGLFDRLPKRVLLGGSLAWLALCFLGLGLVTGQETFLGLGVLSGLAIGVAMPMINALAFNMASPKLRAFNSNLAMQMFQAGYFLGPLLASPLVALWGYVWLFPVCAGLCLLALLLVPGLGRRADRPAV